LLLPVLALAGQARSSAATCVGEREIVRGTDGWESITPPTFPAGEQRLRAYAVDPYDPATMFVSNGTSVMASRDGGCTFSPTYSPSDSGPLGDRQEVTSIVIPENAAARSRIYLTIAPIDGLAVGGVVASFDSGATWGDSSRGLPPIGAPKDLVVSESDPARIYLVMDTEPASLVYSSEDAGRSWSLNTMDDLTQLPGAAGMGRITDLAVHPMDPDLLWASTSSGLYNSDDAGRSWVRVDDVDSSVGTLEVWGGGSGVRVLAFDTASPSVYWSEDAGESWKVFETPPDGPVESAAHDARGRLVISAAAPSAAVYAFDATARQPWRPLTLERPPFIQLTAGRSPGSPLHALTSIALMRTSAGSALPTTPPDLSIGRNRLGCERSFSVPDAASTRKQTASLSPPRKKVVLSLGESVAVDYGLVISRVPVPFDVFFLIDSSASMDDDICGVRDGLSRIIVRLTREIPDIFFGVAEYNHIDGQRDPGHPQESNSPTATDDPCLTAYRLAQKLAAPDDEVLEALKRLLPVCGGSEPALIALKEAALGEGQDIDQVDSAAGRGDIPPGYGAGFRGGLRVIVHVTDERLQYYAGGPTQDEVIEILAAKDIYQVGLGTRASAQKGLEAVALGTGAVAPPGGLDCDREGLIHLSAGAPLVCPLPKDGGLGWSAALTGLLDSIEVRGPVTLDVDDGGSGVVASVSPPAYANVDFRRNSDLSFTVTYTCDARNVGTTSDVRLRARADGRPLDQAIATVVCQGLPLETVPPTTPIAAAGPPALPPPPPVNVPNSQPNPQPQPRIEQQAQQQAQQQSQAQAQAVTVAQRQEQPQVALVHAAQAVREDMGYAMARVHEMRDPLAAPKAMLGIGAVALFLAYGCSRVVRVARVTVGGLRPPPPSRTDLREIGDNGC